MPFPTFKRCKHCLAELHGEIGHENDCKTIMNNKQLTSAQDAIKQAMNEGIGWGGTENAVSVNDIMVDPRFWQALGEARGWCRGQKSNGSCNDCEFTNCIRHWRHIAVSWFRGVRLSNGDENKFWQTLP